MSSAAAEARKLWEAQEDGSPIPIWVDCDTGHDVSFVIHLRLAEAG